MPVMAAGSGPKSRQKLIKFFEESDKDGNGYLCMKELKAALKKQGYRLSTAAVKVVSPRMQYDYESISIHNMSRRLYPWGFCRAEGAGQYLQINTICISYA